MTSFLIWKFDLIGLKRNGKSCRLRWVNYLRPDLKRGQITPHEERIIVELHARWGNRWSTIARSLPGRTDNEIKNYWRTHFKKKVKSSDNTEKARARLLRRQQFQLQQQQQQLLQQSQLEQDQLDMKKIVSLLFDEGENRVPSLTQLRQEIMYPSSQDEHGLLVSMINNYESMPDQASNDVDLITWDELWNLDDHLNGIMTAAKANNSNYQNTF
ncbi:hypothetical protein ACS0TY_023429 [Phlomoides rotata]